MPTWSAVLTSLTMQADTANIIATFVYTRSSDGATQTQTVPSSTWTAQGLTTWAQNQIVLLNAREAILPQLTASIGPVAAALQAP